MARGRKRKAGKRHPSGKLVQARIHQPHREAMSNVREALELTFGVSQSPANAYTQAPALCQHYLPAAFNRSQSAAGKSSSLRFSRPHPAAQVFLEQGPEARGPTASAISACCALADPSVLGPLFRCVVGQWAGGRARGRGSEKAGQWI